MGLKEILEKYPDESFLTADGLESAVIGVDLKTMCIVYDKELCTNALMDNDGMDYEEAVEFLEFNTYCAYVGEKTPIFVDYIEDEEGYFEGELCNRDGCFGIIETIEKEGGCYCHTGNPPCGYCTQQNEYCEKCGWEAENA